MSILENWDISHFKGILLLLLAYYMFKEFSVQHKGSQNKVKNYEKQTISRFCYRKTRHF